MNLLQAQQAVLQFDKERDWDARWDIKDLCLNLNEEIGELWTLIKWLDKEDQQRVIMENHEEAADFVGDTLFLVLKIANQLRVDCSDALIATLSEYEDRMPAAKIRVVKHANKLAGGVDSKKGQFEDK